MKKLRKNILNYKENRFLAIYFFGNENTRLGIYAGNWKFSHPNQLKRHNQNWINTNHHLPTIGSETRFSAKKYFILVSGLIAKTDRNRFYSIYFRSNQFIRLEMNVFYHGVFRSEKSLETWKTSTGYRRLGKIFYR